MRTVIVILTFFFLTACATQNVPQAALPEGEERFYDVSPDMAFGAALQALQAANYQIIYSDPVTGFISAKSPTRGQSRYTPVSGFGQAYQTLAVTSHIKSAGNHTSKIEIRLLSINQDSSLYGTARHFEPVHNSRLYEDIFEKISLEL